MIKALGLAARLSLVALTLTFTSCQDGNLFGKLHKTGESGDVASLLSDAEDALRSKNYSQALALYEQILAQDPDNSEALYGAAAAGIGVSGLNFGTLVANIMAQGSAAPSVNGIGDAVAQARESVSASDAGPDSILAGIDLDALSLRINTAICYLQTIVGGAGDGSIASTDIDVILNLGFLYLVRAVLEAIRADFIDITNIAGEYAIEEGSAYTGNENAFCQDAANDTLVENTGKDLAAAYALFNRAVALLGLNDNAIITRLRDDINDAAAKILAGGSNELDDDCIATLSGVGITAASFTNQTTAFQPPAGSCS